jgi:hypothetical protein
MQAYYLQTGQEFKPILSVRLQLKYINNTFDKMSQLEVGMGLKIN